MDWVTRRNTRHVGGRGGVESYVHLRVSHGVPFIRADARSEGGGAALGSVKQTKM